MSNQHTPGPWAAVHNDFYWEISSKAHGQIGDACASNYIYVDGRLLSEKDTKPIAEANARLMAAAPELLAALERIAYSALADTAPILRGYAQDAIDKAVGRSQP